MKVQATNPSAAKEEAQELRKQANGLLAQADALDPKPQPEPPVKKQVKGKK